MTCEKCNDTGIEETGSNDFPCTCPAGAKARFNVSTPLGLRQMTGNELEAYLASVRHGDATEDK